MKCNRLSCLCSAAIVLSAHVSLADSLADVQELISYKIDGSVGGFDSFQPFSVNNFTNSHDPDAEITLSKDLGLDFFGGNAAGNATTRASQGALGVGSSAIGNSSGYKTGGNVSVNSWASMQDNWTFTTGFVDGAPLHVMGAFKLSGSQNATAGGEDHQPGGYMDTVAATAASALYVLGTGVRPGPYQNGAYAFDQEDMGLNAVDTKIHQAAPPYAYFDFIFHSGVPQNMNFQFDLDTGVSVISSDFFKGGSSNAFADFSHTLLWNGITSVTDENGNAVNDWKLNTESGVDYAHAILEVPEPSTGAILLAALPIAFLLRRRKSTGTTRCR